MRGKREILHFLRCKNTNNDTEMLRIKESHNETLEKYNKLQTKYKEIQHSLDIIQNQNMRLGEVNKDLLLQLYSFKNEFEAKVKKVLFSFYIVSNYKDEETIERINDLLKANGIQFKESTSELKTDTIQNKKSELIKASEQRHLQISTTNVLHKSVEKKSNLQLMIQELIKSLAKRLIFDSTCNDKILDEIVTILLEFINAKLVNQKFDIKWDSIAKEVFKEDNNHCPFANKKEKNKEEDSQVFVPRFISKNESVASFSNMNSGFFNPSLSLKNDSFYKSNSGNLNRESNNEDTSFNDNNFSSGVNSFHLISPRNENENDEMSF